MQHRPTRLPTINTQKQKNMTQTLVVATKSVATLNDWNSKGWTQLSAAVYALDVESVTFLLLQKGIQINKLSMLNSSGGQNVYLSPFTLLITMDLTKATQLQKRKANEIYALLLEAGGMDIITDSK